MKYSKPTILLSASFFLIAMSILMQMNAAPQAKSESAATSDIPAQYQWRDEKWNKDNSAYSQSRSRIEEEFHQNSAAESTKIYTAYQKLAQDSPTDPLAQFNFAYATWVYKKDDKNFVWLLSNIDDSLSIITSPKTYDWYRLRFLIQTSVFTAPELEEVGKRLLEVDKDDYDVMFGTLRTMDVVDLEQRKQVLRYSKRLIEHSPNVSKYRAISGMMHFGIYLQTHDAKEKEIAVEELELSLKLLPSEHPKRAAVKFWIQKVKES